MNNFLNRFYFLSKFTTSLILLILLILLSFLFVKSYLNQKSSSNSKIEIKELSNQIADLTNIVKQNTSNLNTVKGLIQANEQSMKDTNISSEILNNLLLQTDKLSEESKKMKDELYNFSLVINNLKNFSSSFLKINKSSIPVNNIIKLIRLKLDNGLSFKEEVKLLNNLAMDAEYLSNVEKLSIYATENFFGLDKLHTNFDQITSNYLNDYYLKKNNNHFIKYFFNLVLIQPNLNEHVEDETVLLLSLIKQNLLDKNINESIKQLKTMNNVEYYFSRWMEQATYYEQMINLLNKF